MTPEQELAIRCAYADLKGSMEAREALDLFQHDWGGHQASIDDLERVFPFLKED